MRFLNLIALSACMLSRFALPQVIVTVTEVVTVDPVWTTTVTTIITVTKSTTTTKATSTTSKSSTTTRRPGGPGGPPWTSGGGPPWGPSTVFTTVFVTETEKTKSSTTTRRPGGPGASPTTVFTTVVVTETGQPQPTNGDPNATKCPAPLWYQCGGKVWTGCKTCEKGLKCWGKDEWFSQCLTPDAIPTST
ncbi:Cellulose-binding protein [Glarea lozoyensis ATCC 20868]|uniref:Cellulose-binding protein n=2 Tax=Glarea lozoyensis TaxID=101852 RepID=S3DSA6_GLAL2|nr:Cellulose-binding protein [Glarea lozoyensis ATCC 20868]EHK96735.1 putative endoglucanase type F [Glarea lozoyensis 74030]EPE34831.1 Cellulose-binding protein [Glarea lozoyensis ATCC 20868]